MAGGEVERYRRRLELLAAGKLVEAQELVLGSSAAAKKAGGDFIDTAMEVDDPEAEADAPGGAAKGSALDYNVAAAVKGSAAHAKAGLGPRNPATLTSLSLEAMIETAGELLRKQPAGKCQNCGAHNPAIKREGFAKLFVMPLPAKKRAANMVQGTPILGVLQRLAGGEKEVAVLEAELAAKAAEDAAARKRRRRDAAADESKEEAASQDGDDDKDVKMDGSWKDEGSEEEEEEEEAASKGATPAPSAASAGLTGDNPTYLTPTEVREIMRRMWELSEPLLAYVYPTEVARRQRRRSGSATAGAAAGNAAMRRAQGYRDFFLQTVPVAPNRFRPVNRVGDIVYEHPQNTLLAKLVNGNLDLLAASRGSAELGVDALDAATAVQAQLGRTLRLWLDLQNSLNGLLDSTAAEDAAGAAGIRQQLEKKEGLFRKNMMGKRVNFAARSVISPDVYLNGGEIGVPPYFASRLSYPERVTPWNVERLREAVMAGPGKNPGAVAVEDERGRIVMLRKDKNVRELIVKGFIVKRPVL